MELKFQASVMKVGNGLAITIPKIVCDTFHIEKGDNLPLVVNDDGIFIPLTDESAEQREGEALRTTHRKRSS